MGKDFEETEMLVAFPASNPESVMIESEMYGIIQAGLELL
jgi:hypothetical protein